MRGTVYIVHNLWDSDFGCEATKLYECHPQDHLPFHLKPVDLGSNVFLVAWSCLELSLDFTSSGEVFPP